MPSSSPTPGAASVRKDEARGDADHHDRDDGVQNAPRARRREPMAEIARTEHEAEEPRHARDHRAGGEEPPRVSVRRSEEHTSELQSLMRSSYAVFCLKNKTMKQ